MEQNSTLVKSSFDQYTPKPGCFDEYLGPDGSVRPAWTKVGEHLRSLGEKRLNANAVDVEHTIRENGSTFLASGDAKAQVRPWQLSSVPFLIDGPTWSMIEAGLKQRVRLLEAVLTDLFGQQQLIRDGVLPAELLSANPKYERAFHELPSAGPNRLPLTASDLARDEYGNWRVIGHRSRAPSGLGYALENRIVTSRVLQQAIQGENVPRLASFFSKLHDHLRSLATRSKENPRIAILTPGQSSYRYFEDIYLARYLGYTLVQGRDLAVRGNRLHLKTLGGLLPIEVLWRHISDSKCDPLEMDPTSEQGVTGMLQSARSKSLAVVNSIGSVLAETPALMSFLPAAARALFGEELLLPNVESYWCGDDSQRAYVLANLDNLLIRPAFAVGGNSPVEPATLSRAAREELIAQINSSPHQYLGMPRPARSTTPVWTEGKLEPWYVGFRAFHLQTEKEIDVMPGGLVRVSSTRETLDGNPTSGHFGQDCWVVSNKPVDQQTSLLPSAAKPVELVRSGNELPSRVAENFFWLGRYVERTEAIARLVRTTASQLAGENELDELDEVPRLSAALAAVGQIEPDFAIAELGTSLSLEEALLESVFDESRSRGLRSGTKGIIANAVAVRDRLSNHAYRILTRIEDGFSGVRRPQSVTLGVTILHMDGLMSDLSAFTGIAAESMTRTHAWRFLQLGRRIERAYQTAELLSTALATATKNEPPVLASVLRASDCLMTYRTRYLTQLQPAAAIDLLVTDDTNPRSLMFQMKMIVQLIRALPSDTKPGLDRDEQIAQTLYHQVSMADPMALATPDATNSRRQLLSLMTAIIDGLPELSDAVTARYLIHTGTQILTGQVPQNER